jgi:diacylglycerol O-acyltransferase
MEQLTMLDAGFLEAEDADPHVSLAIGALSVIAGPMPDFDLLVTGLAQRILAVPRFQQVLRTHPLDLGAPQWTDDANLDVSHHGARRCRAQVMTRPCSGGSPRSWSGAWIEIVRFGSAGSLKVSRTIGGRF